MRAIRVHQFGGPEVMVCEEVGDLTPAADEILAEVNAAGINPVDTYIRSGSYSSLPKLPYTPGFDAAGVVLQTGKDVRHYRPGDRIYISGSVSGTYAEHVLCHSHQIYPLPKNLAFEQGAAIGIPYATAYRALFTKARAVNGEIVLVHGASGAVGIAAVQLARGAGLQVIASAGSAQGRELLRGLGAELVVDHHCPEHWQQIDDFTEGRGVSLVLEMLAEANLPLDLKHMSRNGRIIVIGCRGEVKINPRDAMRHDVSIIGMLLMNATSADRQKIFASLEDGFQQGGLSPVIARSFPLSEVSLAHEFLLQPGAAGKIVLLP